MLKDEQFREKFSLFIDAVWTLQHRVTEILEFEKQWASVFETLKAKTGKDCSVTIRNLEIYRGFRWDKYHVAVTDMLSVIENAYQNENSMIYQAPHHLRVYSIERYINPKAKVTFFYGENYPQSSEDEAQRRDEGARFFAEKAREQAIDGMRRLFPKINDSFVPGADDVKDLKQRLFKLREKVHPHRSVFAHKHQEIITARYKDRPPLVPETLEDVANSLLEIAKCIATVAFQRSYSPFSFTDCSRSVQDQIDLILFGSIGAIDLRFREAFPDVDSLVVARDLFFQSEHMLTLISSET